MNPNKGQFILSQRSCKNFKVFSSLKVFFFPSYYYSYQMFIQPVQDNDIFSILCQMFAFFPQNDGINRYFDVLYPTYVFDFCSFHKPLLSHVHRYRNKQSWFMGHYQDLVWHLVFDDNIVARFSKIIFPTPFVDTDT